ncbi:hypothetical protein PFISCL1PPCAC_21716, partial [Pristionchus fissidentatus]
LLFFVSIIRADFDHCTCPPRYVTMDRNNSTFTFEIDPECDHVPCRSTVKLAQNLRDKYRIKVEMEADLHAYTVY